jgi:hypothetical protein
MTAVVDAQTLRQLSGKCTTAIHVSSHIELNAPSGAPRTMQERYIASQ